MERAAYEDAVWGAVQALWRGIETLREPGERSIAQMIGEAHGQGQPPEPVAILIVTFFVTRYIAESISADRRKLIVGEIRQILSTSFEDVQGQKFDPFVHRLVTAWQVAQDWIAGGRIDKSMSQALMGKIIAALRA
jgi:hypothetical protein